MSGKRYTGFRCRLLAVLLLLVNLAGTAAPVSGVLGQSTPSASLNLGDCTGTTEADEESRFAISSFICQSVQSTIKKESDPAVHTTDAALCGTPSPTVFPSPADIPRPSYYTFLFRYNLF